MDAQQTDNKSEAKFEPGVDWTLLSQGAEARIWKIPAGEKYDEISVAKERFPKAYRHPDLDQKLTRQRCRAESRILTKCMDKGVRVPKVLRTEGSVLYLEYIQAKTVRTYLEDDIFPDSNSASLAELAGCMGDMVASIHNLGIVHGDLTTSNMMIRLPEKVLVSLDFGLAKNTESAEERAVDLYVLERALASTHPQLPETFWPQLLENYKLSCKKADATLKRLEQVQLRGRKRECFG